MPAIEPISALPTFVSREEHLKLVASTPESFKDISPVLQHQEQNVAVTFDPAVEQFSAEDLASGSLYVIESALVFMSQTGKGFSVQYPSITLHAVSRTETGPSIYCQLDESSGALESAQREDDVADTDMRELTLIPKNAESLDTIFEALSYCASLHPDPNDEVEDDGDDAFIDADEGGFEVFTGAEGEELSEVGRAALAHIESIIYDPFHPADDDEDDDEEEREEDAKKEETPEESETRVGKVDSSADETEKVIESLGQVKIE